MSGESEGPIATEQKTASENTPSNASPSTELALPKRCPNCGKENTFVEDSASGELVCTNCGYVLKEKVEEEGPEWRSFPISQGEVSRARAGSPTDIARPDMGLSTVIGTENRDAAGRALSSSMRNSLERLRTWDKRTQVHTSQERDLRRAFSELSAISSKMNLGPSIVEKAAYIYRKVLDKKLIRGRTISGLIAAAVFAALRESDAPRTIKDIAQSSRVGLSDIRRDYRLIVRELDLRMPVLDPRRLVSRIAKRVGAKERTESRAIDLLKRAEEIEITTGKDPTGVAAAAVYLASLLESEAKTEKEISKASGVTEVTVRARYAELKDRLGIVVPGR